MIALICLLVPPLLYILMRKWILQEHRVLYKNALLYIISALILNSLMLLILYFGFDSRGQLFYKLNHYLAFAGKYFLLSACLALAEIYIEKPFARLVGRVKSREPLSAQERQRTKEILFKAVLSLAVAAVLLLIGSFKNGYHVDEMYTFGLSNHQYSGSIAPDIEDGAVYTGEQLWQEYTTVGKADTFDYSNVIENQTHDVHPPLYYALVHTVFSLFPGTFNMLFALIVNVALAVIVFWQMVWLFQYFIKRKKLSILLSLLFIFTMGSVNSVVFFRMYVLLTVWTNALVILFCKYPPKEADWRYYIRLTFILVGGTMTQYYFLIFAFFACGVYAIRVALEKSWWKLVLSVASAALSAGISTLLFPAMWTHIFSGSRGQEAFSNLSGEGLWEHLWSYIDILNLRVFGNLFLFLAFLLILLFVVSRKPATQEKQALPQNPCLKYLQIIIPALCYVVVIAQIAPYQADRYVMNIMGLLYLAVFAGLVQLSACFSRQSAIGILAAAALVLFCSYQDGIPYLYRSESDNISTIADLDEDVSCLYVYDSAWKAMASYSELESLNEIVFVKSDNLELLNDEAYHNYDKLLVYVISTADADEIITQLLEENPSLDSYTKLFSSWYATAYYLE